MIELSASLMTQIVKVLLSTFKWEDLVARVMRPLKVPDGLISESYDLDERVKVLVRWARDERRVEDLVRTARQANHSPQLEMLAESLGLAPASLSLVDSLAQRWSIPCDGRPAWWKRSGRSAWCGPTRSWGPGSWSAPIR